MDIMFFILNMTFSKLIVLKKSQYITLDRWNVSMHSIELYYIIYWIVTHISHRQILANRQP